MKSKSIILLTALLLTSCATSYQTFNDGTNLATAGLYGGFDETQISENTWRVKFKGNGYTTLDTTETFALRRSAELCLEKGYTHFYINQTTNSDKGWSFTTLIVTFTNNPSENPKQIIYDAKLYTSQINN